MRAIFEGDAHLILLGLQYVQLHLLEIAAFDDHLVEWLQFQVISVRFYLLCQPM